VQGNRERWYELREQASVEQDSKKLAKLIEEIVHLLVGKKRRLDDEAASKKS
jgi:hypothetical protein